MSVLPRNPAAGAGSVAQGSKFPRLWNTNRPDHLWAAVSRYAVSTFVLACVSTIAHSRLGGRPGPAYADPGFRIFRTFDWSFVTPWLPVWVLLATIVYTGLFVLRHPLAPNIFKRVLILGSLMNYLRCGAIISTSVPSPAPSCRLMTSTVRVFINSLALGNCGGGMMDCVTALALITLFARLEYDVPYGLSTAKVVHTALAAATVGSQILCRQAHTIDVVTAGLIAWVIWASYHAAIWRLPSNMALRSRFLAEADGKVPS
eukprot:TRINITY_DN22263_c0_g1_i1.p1 TRINITY_DN22263_c0_g1~~TRINITY_DN22263_c0_g1_i1.p1  ORF type:complete len:260 (+),score=15.69 TRINITY_DN22263_c0_g1_i1:61-840(+)